MKIVCIGWGSLIWNPGKLKVEHPWFEDGPLLPIEFTRISSDKRVTLIIDEFSQPVRTLWAWMTVTRLREAKESLLEREGISERNISLIHSIGLNETPTNAIHNSIKDWLFEKQVDAAIWTGLSYSKETERKRPTIDQIINHLNSLEGNTRENAEEYIKKAPPQISTPYRKSIDLHLGLASNRHTDQHY